MLDSQQYNCIFTTFMFQYYSTDDNMSKAIRLFIDSLHITETRGGHYSLQKAFKFSGIKKDFK